MPTLVAAATLTLLLLISRLDLAQVVSLGDAEALYFAYGLHPQPAYLDHPGLIGWIARELGPTATPQAIHTFTALVATALPWIGVAAARGCGASWQGALRTYFALALIPELAIGWFALTPDLPLAVCWLSALGCAGWALRHPPEGFATLVACLAAGAFAALACLSKLSGWLLVLSLVLCCMGKSQRPRLGTFAPWAGLTVFAIASAPLSFWWLDHGVTLNINRDLQPIAALLQLSRPLAYATPPFLYAGWLLSRRLFAARRSSPVDQLLCLALLVPLVPHVLLSVLSTAVADWLTPAYFALALYASRCSVLPQKLSLSCLGLGAAVCALGWSWLRTDIPMILGETLGGYAANHDASNDLYTWGPARDLLDATVQETRDRTGHTPLVIGPHWAVCAQADSALAGKTAVGCDTQSRTDYDSWMPRQYWSHARTVLYVTDSRFHERPVTSFNGRSLVAVRETTVERFGRTVRRVSVSALDNTNRSAQARGDSTERPAAAIRSRSSSVPGLGVVNRRSP